MKKLLLAALLLVAGNAQALSIQSYVDLSAKAKAGDKGAERLIESFIAGSVEGLLVANAMSPLPDMCLPSDFSITVHDVYPLMTILLSSQTYRQIDRTKVPFSKALADALALKNPCKP